MGAAEVLQGRLVTGRGSPRLTLLSPTPERLTRLFKVWDRELAKMAKAQELKLPKPLPRAAFAPDLTAIAEKKTAKDRSVANGSSIALLLEHRGASVLVAADVFEPVLTTALWAVAQGRGASLPLQLDALKLSHHGSQANVTTELFGCVQARHHVVSTNGAIFGHPDDTAIARTILHGGSNHSLWFNYGNERNRRWSGEPLQARYGYGSLPRGPRGRRDDGVEGGDLRASVPWAWPAAPDWVQPFSFCERVTAVSETGRSILVRAADRCALQLDVRNTPNDVRPSLSQCGCFQRERTGTAGP